MVAEVACGVNPRHRIATCGPVLAVAAGSAYDDGGDRPMHEEPR
jgi:hypothetical protein